MEKDARELDSPNVLQFEPYINYESIICTHFPTEEKEINAACMGVHFTTNNEVYIHAYHDSHTRKLLTPGRRFSINFSENFYEYAAAGLRRKDHDQPMDELPRSSFYPSFSVPILKNSWAAVECEVLEMPDSLISKPPCKRREEPNIRAKIIERHLYHLPKIFNNRSMNLAFEALVLATRIPLYLQTQGPVEQALNTYVIIKKKIISWRDMDRFHAAFELMDNFLIEAGIKPQQLSFI